MSKEISPYVTKLHQGNAYWMARLSHAVYKNKKGSRSQDPDSAAILKDLRSEDKGFISVIGANKNSAQAILVEHEKFLCMAFRGTNELSDWLDNINAFSTDVLFGSFHRGFWNSVADVWDKINGSYEELRKKKKRPLFITGHSLGGAMAAIAAARFIHDDRPFISVYTFGQPRCAGRDAARIFNTEAGGRCHRFQNNEDIVTRVPARLMGYSHVGHCLYIDEGRAIHSDPGFWFRFLDVVEGAYDSIKTTGSVGMIKDHDMQKYMNAVKKWDYHKS